MNDEPGQGVIGRATEQGLPVIYRFVDELPDSRIQAAFGWLTVIGWAYDGSGNNGMPETAEQQAMTLLEETLEQHVETADCCHHAYNRTGNNLKEFVYYIADREQFMTRFNTALAGMPELPLDIRFYEDAQWQDLRKLLADFADG